MTEVNSSWPAILSELAYLLRLISRMLLLLLSDTVRYVTNYMTVWAQFRPPGTGTFKFQGRVRWSTDYTDVHVCSS